jgi:type I restriction enzyme S subunit
MSDYPLDWRECLLSEVVEKISSGGTPKADNPELYGGGIPFLKIDDITSSSKYLTSHKVTINERGLSESSAKIVPTGTLLLTMYGTIGRCCITTYPVATNQAIASFLVHPQVELEYLYYALESKADEFATASSQTTQANISARILKQTPIAIPPLPEQKKIAEILSGIDEQISLMKKDLERIKTTKYAILMQLTCNAGQGDLSKLCKNWEEVTIEEICEIHDSKRIPLSGEQRQSRKGVYPYYGANNIQDYIDDFIFDFDSVLLAEDGGYYEQHSSKEIAQYATGKYWVNNHAHILTSKEGATTKFIYYSLVHKNICSWINTGTRAKLNQSDLKQITIPLPPLEYQEKSVELLDSFESAVNSKIRKISKLSCVKQAISSDLLSGRKRASI